MLIALKNLRLALGSTVLLDGANLAIGRGERVCLVGRNGTGKSTLLKLITGELHADSGEIVRAQGVKIAQLAQDVPARAAGTVYDVVAQGLGETGTLLARYHHALDEGDLHRMGKLQSQIEARNAWALDHRVEAEVSRLGLPGAAAFADLSGGLRRRVLLAQALVAEPDLLLLDEPTNHLDIESIDALEELVRGFSGAVLFITHDRAFLRRLATRIWDLDRGRLSDWPGDYDAYLRGKQEALHAEAQHDALFDKRLAQEEAWIRKGVEARRTRSAGRVKALMQMRKAYGERRTLTGQVNMAVSEAERSGRLVAELDDVSHGYGERTLVRRLSTTILRGDKVGLIGPNGAGKTTLLNILLGRLAPGSGSVRLGTNLQVAYFDQLRAQLDDDKSAAENIGGGRDYVEINGARKHVMGYLQDFLFAPDRARSPARALSGGERSRLLLARLFAQPSNLLVLDEPTNDLDLETLDLLEELLVDYAGTVLLVSHDREFLDNVVTRSLVFEGGGKVGDYVGGYADWLRQRPATAPPAAPASTPAPPRPAQKLDARSRRELSELPARIEKLEAEQHALAAQLGSASRDEQAAASRRLAQIEHELAEAFERWEALEAQRG